MPLLPQSPAAVAPAIDRQAPEVHLCRGTTSLLYGMARDGLGGRLYLLRR